jgi:hypothetical protein
MLLACRPWRSSWAKPTLPPRTAKTPDLGSLRPDINPAKTTDIWSLMPFMTALHPQPMANK